VEERERAVELIAEAVVAGARRKKACEIVGISLRTLQRWEGSGGRGDQRRGPGVRPANALSEAEKELVVAVATSPSFRDLSPAQIVPVLADMGTYVASERSFYRILRERQLDTHRGRAKPRQHARPEEQVATGPNECWSWDITYLKSPIRGQFWYLYLVVDVWSRKIVGWTVEEKESAGHAKAMIVEACLREGVNPGQLVLHSDNGGPMKGATLLATLQNLGIVPSFSRPRVSDDNPYSEALFRTVKYRPEYPQGAFESVEAARAWVKWFVGWYNLEHRHSGIRFVTPGQRHNGEEAEILRRRKQVYEEARKQNPNRWSGATRNWEAVGEVILNSCANSSGASQDLEKSA